MLRLAVTGGLCSGKSTVSAFLRELGCPVIDADAVGHELLRGEAQGALVAQFGAGILSSSGAVAPARLAALVFAPGADDALLALNRILHPPIMSALRERLRRLEQDGVAVAGVEAALLIEAGALADFDRIILVVADAETRIRRFMDRTGGTREQALARMARQLPDEDKIKRADVVVDNNGSLDATRSQVEAVMAQWRSEVRA